MYVLIKNIGRRLPLELQCSLYQGQQVDVNRYVRGNYTLRFRGGQTLTALEGNASVYQVYPGSHITGKRSRLYVEDWIALAPRTDLLFLNGADKNVATRKVTCRLYFIAKRSVIEILLDSFVFLYN